MTSGARYHLVWISHVKDLGWASHSSAFSSRKADIESLMSWNLAFLSVGSSHFYNFENFVFYIISKSLSISRFWGNTLAIPKSHILMLHWESISILAGLRSLWIILAEWMKCSAHRELYRIVIICLSSMWVGGSTLSNFLKSLSMYSITMNTRLIFE